MFIDEVEVLSEEVVMIHVCNPRRHLHLAAQYRAMLSREAMDFFGEKSYEKHLLLYLGAPPKPCMQVRCPEGLEEPKYRCKAVENEDGDNWDYLA